MRPVAQALTTGRKDVNDRSRKLSQPVVFFLYIVYRFGLNYIYV